MNPLNSIIVDDEWLVREELKTMLGQYPEIRVVAEAADVPQAVEAIKKYKPGVLFLDIQMPGASGFDLLEKIKVKAKIIFITAYDKYAIKAFEVNALDYLLKPITKERLTKAVKRLIGDQEATARVPQKVEYDDIVYIVVNGSVQFLKVSLLKCILAEGNYSYIYYKDRKKDLVSKTLHEWDEILPRNYFVRIHRSTIVNFEYVQEVKKCRNYTHRVYVRDIEQPFMMSRRYASKLKKTLPW